MNVNKCVIVAVFYHKKYIKNFASVLNLLMQKVSGGSLYVVMNNDELTEEEISGEISKQCPPRFVRHNNAGFEFGAYQAGLEQASSEYGGEATYIFCNDTVGNHQNFTKEQIDAFVNTLNREAGQGVIVGKVEQSARIIRISGFSGTRWVRSNFFGLDAAALNALDWKLYEEAFDRLIKETSDEAEFFGSDIGSVFRRHVASWLFATDGHRWYAAHPLNSENQSRMAGKARCIVHETMLALRLDAANCGFFMPIMTRRQRWLSRIKSDCLRLKRVK